MKLQKKTQHFIIIEQLSWIRCTLFSVCFVMIFKTLFEIIIGL